jgi:hypothetical protein
MSLKYILHCKNDVFPTHKEYKSDIIAQRIA